eukprot:TRINITY_DN4220_c0_g1_i2.p1 TRINITY_DN4220_c0_g1~~TRINITY_DN4220_c0_g1_i2.p1  ORF type:complete len:183 (+),score=19.21 TRINITY_DN4220_c0_g1_i2:84-632(+)
MSLQDISYALETPVRAVYETLQAELGADEHCPSWALVFGSLGASLGLAFANAGAAYGIAISCLGFLSLGKKKNPDQGTLMKGIIPAIMASVRGVYGLIIAILIAIELNETNYPAYKGFAHFYSGLCVGLSGFASGYCMGVVGNHGMKAVGKKSTVVHGFAAHYHFRRGYWFIRPDHRSAAPH